MRGGETVAPILAQLIGIKTMPTFVLSKLFAQKNPPIEIGDTVEVDEDHAILQLHHGDVLEVESVVKDGDHVLGFNTTNKLCVILE